VLGDANREPPRRLCRGATGEGESSADPTGEIVLTFVEGGLEAAGILRELGIDG